MVWVTLGLGSNTDAVNNLSSCLDSLLLQYKDMALSSVFESAAEGSVMDGQTNSPAYLNMAVGFETELPLAELAQNLKLLEAKHGRHQQGLAPDLVPLDIDLLTYGNKKGNFNGIQLPRPQILTSAYVLWPLSQVAVKHKHPESQQSYAALWKAFAGEKSAIRPVNFQWHGRTLSSAT